MTRRNDNRIGLIIAAAIAAAAIMIAALVIAISAEARQISDQREQTLAQANVLASAVTAALAFEDRAAAQEYADAMRANPQLDAVAVIERSGRILARFMRPGATPIPRSLHAGLWSGEGRATAVVNALQNGRGLGLVYVQSARRPLEGRILLFLPTAALGILAAVLIGALAFAQFSLVRANRRLIFEMDERSRVEQALRESQKMEAVGKLSGGIAHDFNNLLGIIQGSLQLMRRRIAQGSTDVAKYADMAGDAVQRAANLTRQLLAFSRGQALNPEPASLTEIVRDSIELVRNAVGPEIALDTRLASHWLTLCDVTHMTNVILNLALNAKDAMPDGGTLRLTTQDVPAGSLRDGGRSERDCVELEVADNGAGMAPEVLERALDPFFTTKPVGKGTGLGLSVALGYVRQLDGELKIASTPGSGTTVAIRMPRHVAKTGCKVPEAAE